MADMLVMIATDYNQTPEYNFEIGTILKYLAVLTEFDVLIARWDKKPEVLEVQKSGKFWQTADLDAVQKSLGYKIAEGYGGNELVAIGKEIEMDLALIGQTREVWRYKAFFACSILPINDPEFSVDMYVPFGNTGKVMPGRYLLPIPPLGSPEYLANHLWEDVLSQIKEVDPKLLLRARTLIGEIAEDLGRA